MSVLIDFLFPPRCGGCAARGAWLCQDCRASTMPAREHTCAGCGRRSSVRPCPLCNVAGPEIRSLTAVFQLEGGLREALHRLKYGDRPQLGVPLGELAAAHLGTELVGVLVPVPLHPRRRRSRGYNQAELIATSLGRAAGRATAAGLERVLETAPQVGRGGEERRGRLHGAFAWTAATPPPSRVVVVDDVVTTGATLIACAGALVAAGSGEVHGLGLALG